MKRWLTAFFLALCPACGTAHAQAKYEPGFSRFGVARSVTVIRDIALIRKGPRPDSPEYTDCGRGFTAGVLGQTRTSFRIIFGDIAKPEYGYLAKTDVKMLHQPFHLENMAFYARDLTSHRISYHTEAGRRFAVVEAHLDAWDEIQWGSGIFRTRTPQGTISVRWQRGWASMGFDETGNSQVPEFSAHPIYYVTIDSPKTLPVHLRTVEHGINAVYVNGHWLPFNQEPGGPAVHSPSVPLRPYIRGRESGPGDKETFALNLPGGHTRLVLRMDVYWAE